MRMLGINGAATDPQSPGLLQDDRDVATAAQVAKVVAGIPAIGQACDALRAEGWQATLAGNRITVDDEVFVVLIGASTGVDGEVEARWVIYPIAGSPPVWIVGADSASREVQDPKARPERGQSAERRLFPTSIPRTHVHERRWL